MRSLTLVAAIALAASSPALAQNSTLSSTSSANASTPSASSSASSGGGSSWHPSAANNPGTNPLIPTTISATCQAFLARLNANTLISACITPLTTATSLFSSGATSASSADVATALTSLCSSEKATGCSDSLVIDVLTHFAGNCTAELSAGESAVQASYDLLYILNPFTTAICSKDAASGNYCFTTIASAAANITGASSLSTASQSLNSTVSGNNTVGVVNAASGSTTAVASVGEFLNYIDVASGSLVVQMGSSLARRAVNLISRQSSTVANATTNSTAAAAAAANSTAPVSALLPNTTTFTSTNLPFLFLQPSLSAAALCTNCTQDVLAAFVAWEQATPYASGLDTSGLLAGQIRLWSGIGSRCGNGFLSAIQAKAGSQVAGLTSAAATSTSVVGASSLVVLVMTMMMVAAI